nr:hypothetical protein [Tanacetum cinerariifolium]
MSRDVLTVGSSMRIPLLYRGGYSQWVERLMNYLEEQTDGEAMINSIKNGSKKKTGVVTSDLMALIVEKTKEGYFDKDCEKAKVKDYEYYKTNMLLAKKDKDEQVLLAEDQAWMESNSDSDQEINANIIFMAQIKKVLFESEVSSSSADEKISDVSYYLSESESESEFETQNIMIILLIMVYL